MSSHSHRRSRSDRSRSHSSKTPEPVGGFQVSIRCRHCFLRYTANPLTARCPKCKCPANKPLDLKTRALYAVLPPLSLYQGLMLRKEAPLASFQALAACALGCLAYGALYFLITSMGGPSTPELLEMQR